MFETTVENNSEINFGKFQERLDRDRAVEKARAQIARVKAEATAHNELVAKVFSSRSPVSAKGGTVRTTMPTRIDDNYREAVAAHVRVQRAAFEKIRPELDVVLERRRQAVSASWEVFQQAMHELDGDEQMVAALAPSGVPLKRTADQQHVSNVGLREWRRRVWPPTPAHAPVHLVELET